MRLQSGLISNPSLGKRFQTEWTSFLAVTPANHLAQPGNDLEQKTQDTSGLSSQTEFGLCDPSFASLKTSKDTSLSDSEKSLENWNQWVIKCRGEYSRRVKLAHHTNVNEFLSWLAPQTGEDKVCMTGTQNQRMLSHAVVGLVVPANPSTNGNRQESWATPATACVSPRGKAAQEKKGNPMDTLPNQLMRNGCQINPRWVETLMGLPVGWTMPSCASPVTIATTNCDSLEMGLFQPPQQKRS